MTKALPTIVAAIVAVLGTIAPQIADYVAAHPNVAIYASAVLTIVANFVHPPKVVTIEQK